MTMQRWMESVEYKITEGSKFLWNCYGENAFCLDSWNGDYDGHSFSIIFDTNDQVVYEIQAHDFKNQRAFRWLADSYKDEMFKEADSKGSDAREAWEGVNYVDLEVLDDLFEKIEGIKSGADYDTRVQVPIDFSDGELFQLMKLAHEQDITLNQLVERALVAAVEQYKQESV